MAQRIGLHGNRHFGIAFRNASRLLFRGRPHHSRSHFPPVDGNTEELHDKTRFQCVLARTSSIIGRRSANGIIGPDRPDLAL
jgi:hypothetical protein